MLTKKENKELNLKVKSIQETTQRIFELYTKIIKERDNEIEKFKEEIKELKEKLDNSGYLGDY